MSFKVKFDLDREDSNKQWEMLTFAGTFSLITILPQKQNQVKKPKSRESPKIIRLFY